MTSSVKFKCTIVGKLDASSARTLTLTNLAPGPMCLLSCLSQNVPVPELNYPMFTAAMMGMVVTCSGLDKSQKERMKLLVERMAGVYSSAFHDGVSHLVTAKVSQQVVS